MTCLLRQILAIAILALEAKWILEIDRVPARKPVEVQATRQSNRVFLREVILSSAAV